MKRKPYPSDISRENFTQIEPLLRGARRNTKLELYEVFCAVLYLLHTGCQWRNLPRDFPKWQSVYMYWRKWTKADLPDVSALELALKKSGWRGPSETGVERLKHVLESWTRRQSVKNTDKGYDADKKTAGTKRYIVRSYRMR